MDNHEQLLTTLADYLQAQSLVLSTAESCTAGQMIALLASIPGVGKLLESGYVVYSPEAKQRILHVNPRTIAEFGLTSEEVACEMAVGALKGGPANVAVATTGVAGPDAVDGIAPGTVCLAWVFNHESGCVKFSETAHFSGDRAEVQVASSLYALTRIAHFHAQLRHRNAS